ncbi:hypothetical protein CON42_23195 [Bacillus thuringiensis]|uniref:DUF3784 domain-containing protein n=1 Tax=Bacillus thuringiensis TaxID=1428 RepID=A0AB36TPQ0_BACTU|nr:hypothetical protein [Bacillus thuringiensis]PEA13099.1 hypothetical protein CON42_23195 [Bacillus thuringiensis]PEE64578.1 hypothetical protein COM74_13055 [Bacillus thuringiensis]PEE88880.1 hypothetical protein COM90_10325 [Bacillus thuringiensis]PFB87247.1 hypothetical protein CN273_07270 [Bacillus thuringiensis]PFJ58574.1 hypothetical protein COJ10_24245 [Bacillus thuringiensis]
MTINFFGLAVITILGFFIWKNDQIRRDLQTSYKNDERWQLILIKVNNVTLKFYNLLSLLVLLGFFLGTVVDITIKVVLSNIFLVMAVFIMSRNIVEYFALKYYDKKM